MKKSGFTLIETAAGIAVILIIFSCVMSISRIGMDVIYDIKVKSSVYEIENLLTYAKSKCRSDNKLGKIIINYTHNSVEFKESDKGILKKVQIPDEAKIITVENTDSYNGKVKKDMQLSADGSTEEYIYVSNEGKIVKGYTVSIADKSKIRYDITIGVGIDNITIKEGEIY